MLRSFVPVLVASSLLAGCASFAERDAVAVKPADALTCGDVSYDVTLSDGGAARQLAEAAVAGQLKDLRGSMVTAGLRRLRYEHKPTQCVPFGREVHCRAVAAVCGR